MTTAVHFDAGEALLAEDLCSVERSLNKLSGGDRVQRAARHLALSEGKRLRPLCVLLAARTGWGVTKEAVRLATAVELVHSATLLHDDVVDLGDRRRGQVAARLIYGNAASVFAGDWLLIQAMREVVQSKVPGALPGLLDVIEEMIAAESVQLDNRGAVHLDEATYFEIARGKTASLFRWALYVGARAGGLPEAQAQALARFGEDLGLAFQIVDDTLDLAGDHRVTGKALFTDLREGKTTYPVILALQRDPTLEGRLRGAVSDGALAPGLVRDIVRTGAVQVARARAEELVKSAHGALRIIPDGWAKDALERVAQQTAERRR